MSQENNQQELMFKLSMYEQHIQQLRQQLQAVEQSIVELGTLSLGLEDLKGKKGTEIMASIGRGIFIKSKILDEDLIVDVGGKNFVKKDIPNTIELIKSQIAELEKVKEELNESLEGIMEEVQKLIAEAQGQEEKEK